MGAGTYFLLRRGPLVAIVAVVAASVTAALALRSRASAQPPALITGMTVTHGSLEPGALITYAVTIANPDVVERVTNGFMELDPDLTLIPASPPVWFVTPPILSSDNLTIPAGGTLTVPLTAQVGVVAAGKTAFVTCCRSPEGVTPRSQP